MHSTSIFLALTAISVVNARQMVPEHFRRRVGNENPQVLSDFGQLALPNGQAGTIAGKAVSTLLAGADACAQQNLADEMIDAVKATGDAALIQQGTAIAVAFRQSERNSQPDFSKADQPDTCSLFCQTAPKNAELAGLSQTQSPNAAGDIFFSAGKIIQAGAAGTTPPAGSPNTCDNGQAQVGNNNAQAGNAQAGNAQGDAADANNAANATQSADANNAANATQVQDTANNTGIAASTTLVDQATATITQSAAANVSDASATQTVTVTITADCAATGIASPPAAANNETLPEVAATPARANKHGKKTKHTKAGKAGTAARQAQAAAPIVEAPVVETPPAIANVSNAVTPPASVSEAPVAATGSNVQTFTGNLGGAPPAVENVGGDRPFAVNGNSFVNEGAALQRSCAIQHNACANAANSGAGDFSVADCGAQETECNAV